MKGKVEILGTGTDVTVKLDADTGAVSIGAQGVPGNLGLTNSAGVERVVLAAETGSIIARSAALVQLIKLDGDAGDIRMGGKSLPSPGSPTIQLKGDTADIVLGGNGRHGDLSIINASDVERITLSGKTGSIVARSAALVQLIKLDGDAGDIKMGGKSLPNPGSPTIQLKGDTADVVLGGNGRDGDMTLMDSGGKPSIALGGGEKNLVITSPVGNKLLELSIDEPGAFANILAGGNQHDGRIMLYPKGGDIPQGNTATIVLDAATGDIILSNADCAEEFDVSESVEPGTVMVLADDGTLHVSSTAYDSRVAGVVSGGGNLRPAIVLDRQDHQHDRRRPIALVGKTCCKIDADYGPVKVGDLLTTSPTAGHAMKASDVQRAFGAVIGKALRSLERGQDLIPILVALQ